uniref:TyrKc domain-containing protein n=1 Tax=Macrostomum lignano TaxID=282301 RepID=A0A1I8FJ62_9PLAT
RDTVKHYRIRLLDNGAGFYITSRRKRSLLLPHPAVPEAAANTGGPVLPDHRDQWEIPREQLCLLEQLGSASSAKSWRALFNDRKEEAKIMKRLRHPKLVQLFAVCTGEDPVFIVTELMSHGRRCSHTCATPGRCLSSTCWWTFWVRERDGLTWKPRSSSTATWRPQHPCRRQQHGEGGGTLACPELSATLTRGEYTAKQGAKFPIKWTSPEAALLGRFLPSSRTSGPSASCRTPGCPTPRRSAQSRTATGCRRPVECPDGLYEVMLACWEEPARPAATFEYLRNFFDDFFPATEPSYRLATQDQRRLLDPDRLSNNLRSASSIVLPRSVSSMFRAARLCQIASPLAAAPPASGRAQAANQPRGQGGHRVLLFISAGKRRACGSEQKFCRQAAAKKCDGAVYRKDKRGDTNVC